MGFWEPYKVAGCSLRSRDSPPAPGFSENKGPVFSHVRHSRADSWEVGKLDFYAEPGSVVGPQRQIWASVRRTGPRP